MTNNRPNQIEGRRQGTYGNHGTPNPTSESTKVAVSVKDIKNAMFMCIKELNNTYIISLEKVL